MREPQDLSLRKGISHRSVPFFSSQCLPRSAGLSLGTPLVSHPAQCPHLPSRKPHSPEEKDILSQVPPSCILHTLNLTGRQDQPRPAVLRLGAPTRTDRCGCSNPSASPRPSIRVSESSTVTAAHAAVRPFPLAQRGRRPCRRHPQNHGRGGAHRARDTIACASLFSREGAVASPDRSPVASPAALSTRASWPAWTPHSLPFRA